MPSVYLGDSPRSKGNGYVWSDKRYLKLQRITRRSPLAVVKLWRSSLDVVSDAVTHRGDDEPPPPGLPLQ